MIERFLNCLASSRAAEPSNLTRAMVSRGQPLSGVPIVSRLAPEHRFADAAVFSTNKHS